MAPREKNAKRKDARPKWVMTQPRREKGKTEQTKKRAGVRGVLLTLIFVF